MPSTLQKLRQASTAKFAVWKLTDDDLFTASRAVHCHAIDSKLPICVGVEMKKMSSFRKRKIVCFQWCWCVKKVKVVSPRCVCLDSHRRQFLPSIGHSMILRDFVSNSALSWVRTQLLIWVNFYVTITTYRHILLKNSSGNNPVMTWPIFVHQQKSLKHTIFASLVALRPSLLRNCCIWNGWGENFIVCILSCV